MKNDVIAHFNRVLKKLEQKQSNYPTMSISLEAKLRGLYSIYSFQDMADIVDRLPEVYAKLSSMPPGDLRRIEMDLMINKHLPSYLDKFEASRNRTLDDLGRILRQFLKLINEFLDMVDHEATDLEVETIFLQRKLGIYDDQRF